MARLFIAGDPFAQRHRVGLNGVLTRIIHKSVRILLVYLLSERWLYISSCRCWGCLQSKWEEVGVHGVNGSSA